MSKIFTQYPVLENDRIILKKMEMSDLPVLKKMMQEKEVYRYEPTFLPELQCPSPEAFIHEECQHLFEEGKNIIFGVYAKEFSGAIIGLAELYDYFPERREVSIGYRLRKEEWHKGYATSIVSLLKDYILVDLKLTRIFADVISDNVGSIKALENNGFSQQGEPHQEAWGHDHTVTALNYVIDVKKR